MLAANAMTPQEYVDTLESGRRELVAALRGLVLETLPGIEESIEWGMLSYRWGRTSVVALAAQGDHVSLYLHELYARPELIARHADEIAELETGSNCVWFRWLSEIPEATIRGLLGESARASR
jgi:uncharacterized protein YdhG (YjbR/CyaY superfamily)